MPKGVYVVCLGARCFHSLYLRLVQLFSLVNGGSVRVCLCGGTCFIYKEVLSDHCPFANYEWRGGLGSSPRKILISMKQNRVILESLGLNIHYLKRVLTVYFCRNTLEV